MAGDGQVLNEAEAMILQQQTEIAKHKTLVKELENLVDVQGQRGTWDTSQYMCGMFNGMELSLAILKDREPQYRSLKDELK